MRKITKYVLFVILVISLLCFLLWCFYFRIKSRYTRRQYKVPDQVSVHKKIKPATSDKDLTKVIYMTCDDIDSIESRVLENIKKYYKGYSVEIYGTHKCEDFLYEHYGADTTQLYRELERDKRDIFWGYCILYIKGGYYIDIRGNFTDKSLGLSLDKDVTKNTWYKSTDGSIIISQSKNPALWKFIKESISNTRTVLSLNTLKVIPGIGHYSIPLLKKNDSDKKLTLLHKGIKPVDKNKIDIPILYVNMDRSVSRRKFMEAQTQDLSVPVVRVTGVLVKDKELSEYTSSSNRGAVGCFLAHRNAMKEFIKRGWDSALILEDDGCLGMSNRWSSKLSELECPSWLSQGTTAYIINQSVAKDFLLYTDNLRDLTQGVDILLMSIYGGNPMNEWDNNALGNWGVHPYIYPASHLFQTEIHDISRVKYIEDCTRSVRIIKALGRGSKSITISSDGEIKEEPGISIGIIVQNRPISRSQAVKLSLSKRGEFEIYLPKNHENVFSGLDNIKYFEISQENLLDTGINTQINEHLPSVSFHIVMVCTPNYDNIGMYGYSCLYKYCQLHGYNLTIVRKPIEDLHVNFTKNSAAISVLKSSKADYVVNIDADIIVKDFSKELIDIIDPFSKAVIQAPEDFWNGIDKPKQKIINAGFIVWKNCTRSIEINEMWIEKAKGECKEMANTHPRQQNTFDKCVLPSIKDGELGFLDNNLVGMPHSSVIAQADGNTTDYEMQCDNCKEEKDQTTRRSKPQCKKCKEKMVYHGWVKAGSPTLFNLDNVENSTVT